MSHDSNLPGDSFTDGAIESRGYGVGQLISRVFHPITLNLALFLLVGLYGADTRLSGLAWAAICMLTLALPPTLFFTIRQRQGVYSDEDVSQRHQRNELYIAGLLTALAGMLVLPGFGMPRPFFDLLVAALTIGVVNGSVNLFWKISAHATSVAALATVALLYSYPLGVALWLCALPVGWARVRTRNHTPAQVLAGYAVAIVAVLFAFGVVG